MPKASRLSLHSPSPIVEQLSHHEWPHQQRCCSHRDGMLRCCPASLPRTSRSARDRAQTAYHWSCQHQKHRQRQLQALLPLLCSPWTASCGSICPAVPHPRLCHVSLAPVSRAPVRGRQAHQSGWAVPHPCRRGVGLGLRPRLCVAVASWPRAWQPPAPWHPYQPAPLRHRRLVLLRRLPRRPRLRPRRRRPLPSPSHGTFCASFESASSASSCLAA